MIVFFSHRMSRCQYVGVCGGCSLQHLSYHDQVRQKQESLRLLFGRDVVVHPAPHPFGYRSKADFVVVPGRIGFRQRNNPLLVVDIHECLLLSERANALLQKVRRALKDASFSAYDLKHHRGFLRYVTIREARSTGELMLVFTTTSDEEEGFRSFLEGFASEVTSVYWLVHDGKADDARGSVRLFLGKDHIVENIAGYSFMIRPGTFFQSYYEVAEAMFQKIAALTTGRVCDLYCGVGVISLIVARTASSVLGVEAVASSVRAAEENARLNNLQNVSFVAQDVESFVRQALLEKKTFDTVIVDPPRSGLGVSVALSLARLRPSRILYMSCNPRSLRDDIQVLLRRYRLVSLEAFDMFPQTDHVECLAVLERIS